VARGRSDGRTFILLPEIDRAGVVGLQLLHVRFHAHRSAPTMRAVLSSYRNRYVALRDAVTETEAEFPDEVLELLPVVDQLTESIHTLATRIQACRTQPDGVLQ